MQAGSETLSKKLTHLGRTLQSVISGPGATLMKNYWILEAFDKIFNRYHVLD